MLGDERPYGVNRQIRACYNDCNDYGGGGSGEGSGSVGVEVLRARLTRRDVEDLDLISEISPIRQALGRNRKIQLDVHGYPTGSGYPWILSSIHIQLDVVRAIHGYPTGYPSTAITTVVIVKDQEMSTTYEKHHRRRRKTETRGDIAEALVGGMTRSPRKAFGKASWGKYERSRTEK
jgi:hypothetical protein